MFADDEGERLFRELGTPEVGDCVAGFLLSRFHGFLD